MIPNSSRISDLCQDLLAQCLQRDPARRIEFESFFRHPFLDLEHIPSEDSLEKAAVLIEKAVSLDKSGDLEEALVLYR